MAQMVAGIGIPNLIQSNTFPNLWHDVPADSFLTGILFHALRAYAPLKIRQS
jgi:hypothetical protein